MKKDYSKNDMERIQRGLEDFLEQEIGQQTTDQGPQLYDLREDQEDWDDEELRRVLKAQKRPMKETKRTAAQPQKRASSSKQSKASQSAKSGRQAKSEGRPESGRQAKTGGQAQSGRQKKRRKSKGKRILIAALLVAALLLGGMYFVVGSVYDKMTYVEIESLADAPVREEGVINILLIGSDSRAESGENGRSDAMILLSVNSASKKVYMTSLLRDMYVEIPGYKGNRLNAAYSYGGAELLMETIELNFDIPVTRYVMVSFEAFANVVDAVGGVELELSAEEVEYVNAYLWEYNNLTGKPEGTDYMDTSLSGQLHLNGPQALAYSRNRYMGTDFGRTERQRKVLSAIIRKLPGALVTNPGELIEGLAVNLVTNLTEKECYSLSFQALRALGYEIEQYSIPQEGTYQNASIRGMSVLEVDFEANKQFLREKIYEKGSGTEQESGEGQ